VKLPEDVSKLTATIQRPGSNKKEPVTLEVKPDNTLGKSESVFVMLPVFICIHLKIILLLKNH
jgi:hypothetical protein